MRRKRCAQTGNVSPCGGTLFFAAAEKRHPAGSRRQTAAFPKTVGFRRGFRHKTLMGAMVQFRMGISPPAMGALGGTVMQGEKQKRCGYHPQTAAAVRANRLCRERARRSRRVRRWTAFFGILAVFAAAAGGLTRCARQPRVDLAKIQSPDWIEQAFLDPDSDARTGEIIPVVRDIAIHYVGNPGTSTPG